MEPKQELLLTVPEAARRLHIGRSLLYKLIMTGKCPSCCLGRARRIPADALDRLVAELIAESDEARG
jgi:excisionase family DNA binding protein